LKQNCRFFPRLFKLVTVTKLRVCNEKKRAIFIYSLDINMAHRRKSLAPHHDSIINSGDRKKVSELVGELENASNQADLAFIDALGDGKTRINRRKSLSVTPFKAAALFANSAIVDENTHMNLVQSDPIIEKSQPSTPSKSTKR
jgi:hypothetical protein